MSSNPIRFASGKSDFFTTVNQRVNDYFKSNNISRYGNGWMVFKTICMYGVYFVPFFLILTATVTNLWIMLLLCLVMGVGVAGIGLAVMHDANHGGYSNKPW